MNDAKERKNAQSKYAMIVSYDECLRVLLNVGKFGIVFVSHCSCAFIFLWSLELLIH